MTRKRRGDPRTSVLQDLYSQLRVWGVAVGDVVDFLEARRRWGEYRVFIAQIAHSFLYHKTFDYLWRVLRKQRPDICRWDQVQILPEVRSALTPVSFLITLSPTNLSGEIMAMHTQAMQANAQGLFWWLEGMPDWSQEVWQTLRDRVWLIYQPDLLPPEIPRWAVRFARVLRLTLPMDVAGRLASALLYDIVSIVQVLENIALLELRRPLSWADLEPYLPDSVREFSATRVVPWVLRKDYSALLRAVARLGFTRPSVEVFLRQTYDMWRLWVLTGSMPEYEPAAWSRWGISRRVYQAYHRQGQALTLAQWQAWAREAAEMERRARKGDILPESLLTIGLFRWMRILA